MAGFPWESVVVGLAVAVAAAWAVTSLVRSVKKPGACSSCGSSGACPLVKGTPDCGCDGDGEGAGEPRRKGVALH